MPTVYEIPTQPRPVTMSVPFPNGKTYTLTLNYLFTPNDCWSLDIADSNGNSLIAGLLLITGCDLLEQYAYLGLSCSLFCTTDGAPLTPPRFYNLGTTAHLWLEIPQAA